MQTIVALLALVAVASAGLLAPTVISRAPAYDSAVIKSDRLGGNFAYSTAESHAYAAHTPIVQQVAQPVAVSYSAPAVVAQQTVVHSSPVLSHNIGLVNGGLVNGGLINGGLVRSGLGLGAIHGVNTVQGINGLGLVRSVNGLGGIQTINGLGGLQTINGLGGLQTINGLGGIQTINGLSGYQTIY